MASSNPYVTNLRKELQINLAERRADGEVITDSFEGTPWTDSKGRWRIWGEALERAYAQYVVDPDAGDLNE